MIRKTIALIALALSAWPAIAQTMPGMTMQDMPSMTTGAPPSADVLASSVPVIASNFDLRTVAVHSQNPIPAVTPEPIGSFRMTCNVGRYGQFDPLVYPGQPRAGHLHAFMGNLSVSPNSTYETLRRSGDSSCQGRQGYRGVIWFPAMLNEFGQAVNPSITVLYYKRYPAGAVQCSQEGRACADLPRGLRAIFGTNYALGLGQSPQVHFDCGGLNSSSSLTVAATGCAVGKQLIARIAAPDCWDGVRVDSIDHQSHLAYQSWGQQTGKPTCPPSHPFVITKFSITIIWTIKPGDNPTRWAFSSDLMAGRLAGTTFHADYWEAWDDSLRDRWHQHCINERRSCNAGALGDGDALVLPVGFSFDQQPHLVTVP